MFVDQRCEKVLGTSDQEIVVEGLTCRQPREHSGPLEELALRRAPHQKHPAVLEDERQRELKFI